MNVLISSAGRRCALSRIFRETMKAQGWDGQIVAVDSSRLTAAGLQADTFELVDRCTSPNFLEQVLDICRRHSIDLLVPTIDPELQFYAASVDAFADAGVTVLISAPETIAIASDKMATDEWLGAQGFPSPTTAVLADVVGQWESWTFPLIVKPRRGSASIGVTRIESRSSLLSLAESDPSLMVQELAAGPEFTVDAWVNRDGQCLATVPRRRLEVRGGEVQKAVTVTWGALEDLVQEVVEKLPGAFGPLNVQLIATSDGFEIIEINPRFGGGYPLAFQAGADFATWAVEEARGRSATVQQKAWQSGLVMLRYDDAVYTTSNDVGLDLV